jgi:DNA-binding response OmpR family regulator
MKKSADTPDRREAGLRILIVEDEPGIVELLRVGFTYEGHAVSIADDGVAGLQAATDEAFDLILLDVMLPGLDGFELCQRLRRRGNDTPIIMLTARKETPDRIAGLDYGADDYLTKPFSFAELLARMRAVLRRKGKTVEVPLLQLAGLTVNVETHEAWHDEALLELTPTEFALLELLLRHPRRVFTRETLINRVWGFDFAGDTNVVDVHISHLRQKLGAQGRELIRTVYGMGYSFRPEEDETLE